MDQHFTIKSIGLGKVASTRKSRSTRAELRRNITLINKIDRDIFVKKNINALQKIFGMIMPDFDFAGKNMRCGRNSESRNLSASFFPKSFFTRISTLLPKIDFSAKHW
ncbi:MAG: hypothetical protein LUH17_09240 [Acidaminococcaceae bacterium]|nr:hypothetical protein [Acidaminococcaceae bacterium]